MSVPVVFLRNFAVRKIETGVYIESEIDAAPDVECVPPTEQMDAFSSVKPSEVAARVLSVPSSC
jgi:hypothetical protein